MREGTMGLYSCVLLMLPWSERTIYFWASVTAIEKLTTPVASLDDRDAASGHWKN